jgi:hypothetical protein
MKILTLTAVAVMAFACVAPASAQGTGQHQGSHDMKGGAMMHGGNDHKKGGSMRDTMMMGLTAAEKATAMAMMKKMTSAEKTVMNKRCEMCMKDPHKGMDKIKKVTPEMMHQHMHAGMSKSEIATMQAFMKRMTPAEHNVAMKMVKNCCMHGFKHAGMKGTAKQNTKRVIG